MNHIAAIKYANKMTAIAGNPRVEYRPMPMGKVGEELYRVVQYLDGIPVGVA